MNPSICSQGHVCSAVKQICLGNLGFGNLRKIWHVSKKFTSVSLLFLTSYLYLFVIVEESPRALPLSSSQQLHGIPWTPSDPRLHPIVSRCCRPRGRRGHGDRGDRCWRHQRHGRRLGGPRGPHAWRLGGRRRYWRSRAQIIGGFVKCTPFRWFIIIVQL